MLEYPENSFVGVRLLDLAGSRSKVTYTNHFDGSKPPFKTLRLPTAFSSEKVDINVYIMS